MRLFRGFYKIFKNRFSSDSKSTSKVLAFLLFAICIGISIGAAQFTFGIMTFIAGFIAVYIVYNFPNRNIIGSKDYEIDTDTLIIELPHNSNLKMLYKIIISHSILQYSL